MYTTYHFKSAKDINSDIIEAIKIAFKDKAVSITIKEKTDELTQIPDWQKLLGLKEIKHLKQGNTELKDWKEVKENYKFNA